MLLVQLGVNRLGAQQKTHSVTDDLISAAQTAETPAHPQGCQFLTQQDCHNSCQFLIHHTTMAPAAAAAAPADRLDKISQGQPTGLWRVVLNRRNLAGAVGSLLFGPGLQLGKTGAVVGFCLVRWVYTKTEQYVPFTKRRHNVLLPSVAGECACACVGVLQATLQQQRKQ